MSEGMACWAADPWFRARGIWPTRCPEGAAAERAFRAIGRSVGLGYRGRPSPTAETWYGATEQRLALLAWIRQTPDAVLLNGRNVGRRSLAALRGLVPYDPSGAATADDAWVTHARLVALVEGSA